MADKDAWTTWGERLRALFGFPPGDGLRFWEILSLSGFFLGLGCIAIYACGSPPGTGLRTFTVLALVASAACVSGGVLGFLFGVPRLRASTDRSAAAAATDSFVPNTNLEQISDWLTKIIIGATLVQLGALVTNVNRLAIAVGAALDSRTGAVAGCATMVSFFAGGFMWGYLWCSLRVFKEMSALMTRDEARKAFQQPADGDAQGEAPAVAYGVSGVATGPGGGPAGSPTPRR
jgi:predicted permease